MLSFGIQCQKTDEEGDLKKEVDKHGQCTIKGKHPNGRHIHQCSCNLNHSSDSRLAFQLIESLDILLILILPALKLQQDNKIQVKIKRY